MCRASARSGPSAAWERVGPRNIFDDATGRGETGTLADAASPKSNPQVIYTGGKNNGASSGVLNTLDGGRTWANKTKIGTAPGSRFDTQPNMLFDPNSKLFDSVGEPLPEGIFALAAAGLAFRRWRSNLQRRS